MEWKFTRQLGRIELLATMQIGILPASKPAKTRGHREAKYFDSWDCNPGGGRSGARAGSSCRAGEDQPQKGGSRFGRLRGEGQGDRKSTRLNSSHSSISYAVFCLKKKNHKNSGVKQNIIKK